MTTPESAERHIQDASLASLREILTETAHIAYRHVYLLALRVHPQPSRALSELFLFRLWLTWRAYRQAHAGELAAAALDGAALARLSADALAAFGQRKNIDVAAALGDAWDALVTDRFARYDRDFIAYDREPTLVHFHLVATTLACRLQPAPNEVLCAQLANSAARSHAALLICLDAGNDEDENPRQPPDALGENQPLA